MTKLIVGLGNPGREYACTRHNVGWIIIDEYLKSHYSTWSLNSKCNAMVADFFHQEHKIITCKPLAYMNHSGDTVAYLSHFYHIDVSDILVISDDLDMTIGKIRMRYGGSAGGHNGLKDITQKLSNDLFWRCKYGIGRPDNQDIVGYVLDMFTSSESDILAQKTPDLMHLIDQRIVSPKVMSC